MTTDKVIKLQEDLNNVNHVIRLMQNIEGVDPSYTQFILGLRNKIKAEMEEAEGN